MRGDTFGYLQRSFVGCVSKVDQREAREVGEKAVQYALAGAGDGSVAIRRVGDYAVDYPLIPLETVAGKTRVMEDHLINAAGNDVTPAFDDYLRPLLGADVIEVARLRGGEGREGGGAGGGCDLRAPRTSCARQCDERNLAIGRIFEGPSRFEIAALRDANSGSRPGRHAAQH